MQVDGKRASHAWSSIVANMHVKWPTSCRYLGEIGHNSK